MSVYDKIRKNKKLYDKVLDKNKKKEFVSMGVIALNLLHSGKVRGGIKIGTMNMISADSALGKSFIGLSCLKNAQKAGMECIVIDSEKAFDYDWAENIGIDTSENKLMVAQISNIIDIKQLIQDVTDGYTRAQRENVFILVDSWGVLISQVMLDKAAKGSDTKDMSLPVWKNELANIMKESDCTYYVVNHVYSNTGGFGDPINIPGGKRLYFNCESVVLCQSKAKEKDSDGEMQGAIVSAFTHKGRSNVERKKLKYRIKHTGGLDVFYGLLPDALEHGCVFKPSNGYYSRRVVDDNTPDGDKKFRESQIYTAEFWGPIFRDTDFEDYLEEKYTFKGRTIDVKEDVISDMFGE